MTKKRDRVFIIVMAAAFLFTTVGVSVALIVQIVNENKTKSTTATTAATTTPSTNPNALKGTKMQDFTPVAKIDQLQAVDLQVGTGDTVKAGDTLTVDYTGAIASTGKVFESSLDSGKPATFGLDQVIQGWKDGMPGMKVGGKRRLLIPAAQAYGAQSPSADIPANSDLVFDITLHKIGQ